MTSDARTPAGRIRARFSLRQPARVLSLLVPVWLVVFIVGGAWVFTGVVVPRMSEGVPASVIAGDLALVVGWFVVVGLYARMYARTVREARVFTSGEIVLITVFGTRRTLRPGEVTDVRVQEFFPQPGYTRIQTPDRVLYLGPFTELDELVDELTGGGAG